MRKINMNHTSISAFHLYGRLFLALVFVLGFSLNTFAQEEAEKEEKKQLRSRMSLSAFQMDDDMITLEAQVRAKIDKRYTGLPGLEVTFHSFLADSLEKEIGTARTNADGIASLNISAAELYRDTADILGLMVAFDGNEDFKSSDDDIEIVVAKMAMEVEEEDSLKVLNVLLESRGEPIVDEDVELFVEGLFNPLKVGEGTTDEDGVARINFPLDLPGDEEGNLQIFARLYDHSDYGTVVSKAVKAWGVPIAEGSTDLPRALWSPSPPLWLLITFIAILVYLWFHYLEAIVKLARMRNRASRSES